MRSFSYDFNEKKYMLVLQNESHDRALKAETAEHLGLNRIAIKNVRERSQAITAELYNTTAIKLQKQYQTNLLLSTHTSKL